MAGYVYLLGSRAFRWYKIGKSCDAAIRVSHLGILLPFRVEVIAVWRVQDHHAVERLLHEKYAVNRINGEWFEFNPKRLDDLLKQMESVKSQVALGFSNLEKDRRLKPPHSPKTQKRIDKLTKENSLLREQIQALNSRATIQ